MTNTKEFRALLILKGLTAAELGEKIGLSPQSMSYKINNSREFTLSELWKIREALSLTDEELIRIFFTTEVESEST